MRTGYKEISEARKRLNLAERATLQEIKASYRQLMNRWHPDKCREDKDQCVEMTRKITDAYRLIINYCENYKYSFSEEEIKHYLSDEDWWFERFGSDPMWGKK